MQRIWGKHSAYRILSVTIFLLVAIILSTRSAQASSAVGDLIDQGLAQGQEAAQELKDRLKKINNYFLIGRDLKVDTDIDGNLIVFSNSIDFEGNIDGGVLIVSRDVKINGQVRDNLWVIAEETKIDGNIEGNARMVTSKLDIKGSVTGNMFAIISEANFDGTVTGRAIVIGRSIDVDSADLQGKFYLLYKRPKSE